jgi:hypothetical protein
MGTKAKGTTGTGSTASAASDLTRHAADAQILVVEDGDGRKTVRVTAAFAYTIEAGADGRWASGGILLGGKAVAEMGGNADWRLTLAYGLRNAGLALGNRAVNAVEPRVRGERPANPGALRLTAAQVDGLIAAGLVKAADRDAAIEGAVAAAVAERAARRADRVAKANGGTPAPEPAEPAATAPAK